VNLYALELFFLLFSSYQTSLTIRKTTTYKKTHAFLMFNMKFLKSFVESFGEVDIPYEDVVKDGKKYYLVPRAVKETQELIDQDPVFQGLFLGENKENFLASIALLELIAPFTDKKISLNEKSAYLFICGRDIFEENIESGSKTNSAVIVTNSLGEVLGLAKKENKKQNKKIMYKNLTDIGIFLRKEKRK
jgi:ribosome biogenesis protein Nip4